MKAGAVGMEALLRQFGVVSLIETRMRLEHPAMLPFAAIARPTFALIPVGVVSGIEALFRVGIDAALVRLL